MRRSVGHLLLSLLLLCFPVGALATFDVTWGTSWDARPLQEILDDEYGVGAIDAATQYEGYLGGDADPGYWEDEGLTSFLIKEIAGHRNNNLLGWYEEDLSGPPIIDGIGDGIVFDGPAGAGTTVAITFDGGVTRFGFYMNPNGSGDGGGNAPEPELFFTNRFYNDEGPDGSGAIHAPYDGDPQCLIYNITHLRGGIPTYVLAWEDLDYGSPVTTSSSWTTTDNDFQDLVVEVQALSPVAVEQTTWGGVKALYR